MQRQNEERLIRLMQTYGNDVLRLCRLLLGERTLAEDASQETFLKAYRSFDTLREPGYEKTWLMRIAVNTCRDARRSAWARHNDRRFTPEDLPQPSCPFEERDDTVIREVMRLEPKYREVILMRYYQELDADDCARALGLSRSGFYRRLRRAQSKLRPRLEGWVFDEE